MEYLIIIFIIICIYVFITGRAKQKTDTVKKREDERYDKYGFDADGYDCNGFNAKGYNRDGLHYQDWLALTAASKKNQPGRYNRDDIDQYTEQDRAELTDYDADADEWFLDDNEREA